MLFGDHTNQVLGLTLSHIRRQLHVLFVFFGLTHCPYCDEPVQLKGEDLLAWCPEHGVLGNDLKRGGSVPGCVNDGEQTQP